MNSSTLSAGSSITLLCEATITGSLKLGLSWRNSLSGIPASSAAVSVSMSRGFVTVTKKGSLPTSGNFTPYFEGSVTMRLMASSLGT